MKKAIVTLLVFAIVAFSACISHAADFDDPLYFEHNPDKFAQIAVNSDGNVMFIDKESIRRRSDGVTGYIGIMKLSKDSGMFISALREVNKPDKVGAGNNVPLYVANGMLFDCSNVRFKLAGTVVLGVNPVTTPSFSLIVLYEDSKVDEEWNSLPSGEMNPEAKALLCRPSF